MGCGYLGFQFSVRRAETSGAAGLGRLGRRAGRS